MSFPRLDSGGQSGNGDFESDMFSHTLFDSRSGNQRRDGPKGPTVELIRAVTEMKQRNSTWGCPKIADQINLAFGNAFGNLYLIKDVVPRILAQHYRTRPTGGGPSWLTFMGI